MENNKTKVLDNVKDKIQLIINRKFSSDSFIRRKIDVYHDRLNFCCPYCGDSRTNNRKKRGNLYLDNLGYKCFNCGHSAGINRFLNDFGESLSNEDKLAVHDIQQSAKKFERRTTATNSSMSMTLLNKLAVPKQILFNELNLISPYKNEFISNYLKSRKIDIRFWKYFAYNQDTKELYILNISPSDRVIGYQIRQLDPSSIKERYMSRSLSKMYEKVFNKNINSIIEKILSKEQLGQKYIDEEDGIENIVANLDKLSGMFNIMNIDLTQTITIMEGPIDSLAIHNSIALQGASKKLNGFFDELENIRYLFDNDKMGRQMSIQKLKEHKTVFLWNMYMNNIPKNIKIKDVNDLQKNNVFNLEKIDKCFSNDEFDVMMI